MHPYPDHRTERYLAHGTSDEQLLDLMLKRVPRQWQRYEYFDPTRVLSRLQEVRRSPELQNAPARVRNLRTNKLKEERESWDAAVFCYLMGQHLGVDIRFSRTEARDYDSVFTWHTDEGQTFVPVQMKELVPETLNEFASLEAVWNSLGKYGDSDDLTVAIKINRNARLELGGFTAKDLPVSEVWLYGASTPDQSRWLLLGESEKGWVRADYDHQKFPAADGVTK